MPSDTSDTNQPADPAQDAPSPEQIAEAEKQLLTSAGRRQAAKELSAILAAANVDPSKAQDMVEGSAGSTSPKKHAAAHTGRFFLETAMRRDVSGLTQMISPPFRFEDRVLPDIEAVKKTWLSNLAKSGEPMAKTPPYALAYQLIATVDEFKKLDPDEAKRLDGLELTNDDFVVGSVLASGNVAEALNYVLRWNRGSIKVAAFWT